MENKFLCYLSHCYYLILYKQTLILANSIIVPASPVAEARPMIHCTQWCGTSVLKRPPTSWLSYKVSDGRIRIWKWQCRNAVVVTHAKRWAPVSQPAMTMDSSIEKFHHWELAQPCLPASKANSLNLRGTANQFSV